MKYSYYYPIKFVGAEQRFGEASGTLKVLDCPTQLTDDEIEEARKRIEESLNTADGTQVLQKGRYTVGHPKVRTSK